VPYQLSWPQAGTPAMLTYLLALLLALDALAVLVLLAHWCWD
jgi:hypothetical protein